jgi:mannose-1-phosphate guanylyltransferase
MVFPNESKSNSNLPIPTVFCILAGGRGTRLWPLSTSTNPKQFLRLFGDKSLLRLTVDRVAPLFSKASKLVVITSEKHLSLAKAEAPEARLIAEPIGRDTAGAFVLAIASLLSAKKQDGISEADPVLALFPSDHVFADEAAFRLAVSRAVSFAASNDYIVSLAVPATSAHPGYGYIQEGAEIASDVFRVSSFCEKPSGDAVAALFCSATPDASVLWNTGITIARLSVFRQAFEKYLPPFAQAIDRLTGLSGAEKFGTVVNEAFASLPSISFSSSVQQLADNLAVLKMDDVGWIDVGSWDAWAAASVKDDKGNVAPAEAVLLNCESVAVHSSGRSVVVIGARDLIVIETDKAVLICAPEHAQEVKGVVDILAARGSGELL